MVITPGYLPAKNYGGPVISIYNIVESLKDTYEFFVVTSNYEFGEKERLITDNDGFIDVDVSKVRYLNLDEMNYRHLKVIMNDVLPDIIYINALFYHRLAVPALRLAKEFNIKCIVAPRGGLCKNAMQFGYYKKNLYVKYLLFTQLLNYNTRYQSTSEEETEAILKYLKVNKSNIYSISNIPSIPKKFNNDRIPKAENELRIVFFSRIHPKKNLKFAIHLLKTLSNKITFDIYGPIEDRVYWEKCKNEINCLPKNITVNYNGYLDRDKIDRTLSNYEVFLLPTLSENYGHVIVEALFAGCNILISDNTPWNDVDIFSAGKAISLDNELEFVNYLKYLAELSEDKVIKLKKNAIKYIYNKLNIDVLKTEYIDMFGS